MYTSYSASGIGSCNSRYGFNGELKDKASGGYLLGNGTRLYLPGLGGFTSSDSLSPFSGGGLNPYRYCNADPINLSDPSGHMSQSTAGIIGVVSGIVGLLFAIPTGGASLSVAAAAGIAIETAGITVSSVQIANATDDESSEKSGGSTGAVIGMLAVLVGGIVLGVGTGGRRMSRMKELNQPAMSSETELVGYHGTSSKYVKSLTKGVDINAFSGSSAGSRHGEGFYTAFDFDTARGYAQLSHNRHKGVLNSLTRKSKPMVMGVYVEKSHLSSEFFEDIDISILNRGREGRDDIYQALFLPEAAKKLRVYKIRGDLGLVDKSLLGFE